MPDYSSQLGYRSLPDGSIEATLALTFPNGARRVFIERFTQADGADVAHQLARLEGAGSHEVGFIVGAAALSEGEFMWRAGAAKAAGKSPDDATAMHAWWKSLSVSRRKRVRAEARSMMRDAPASAKTPEAKLKWWASLSPSRRKARRRARGYSSGFVSDVVDTVKSVDRAIDKSVLGKVAQVALPALALARWSFKNPTKAAAFIPGGSTAATAIKTGAAMLPAAKKLAAGKVMAAASKALEATAETPIGTGAARALAVGARLQIADAALDLGTKAAARKLVKSARGQLKGVSAPVAQAAYDMANRTRKNISALAAGKPVPKSKPAPVPVMRSAALGKVRSNRKGKVSPAELQAAMRAGRVFFLEARA